MTSQEFAVKTHSVTLFNKFIILSATRGGFLIFYKENITLFDKIFAGLSSLGSNQPKLEKYFTNNLFICKNYKYGTAHFGILMICCMTHAILSLKIK
jgi:hypothetical protein